MADIEMTVIVKDDGAKVAAEEAMREEIDAGRADVYTFDEFGEYLVKLFKPGLDSINESIAKLKKSQAGDGEPEAEEEIPDPDIGDAIAQAALETWKDRGARGNALTPGPRERQPKPDPPKLYTSEDLEFIPPPEDDAGLIDAAKRTWRKGRGLFGKGKK